MSKQRNQTSVSRLKREAIYRGVCLSAMNKSLMAIVVPILTLNKKYIKLLLFQLGLKCLIYNSFIIVISIKMFYFSTVKNPFVIFIPMRLHLSWYPWSVTLELYNMEDIYCILIICNQTKKTSFTDLALWFFLITYIFKQSYLI